jgi:hypothetical protein
MRNTFGVIIILLTSLLILPCSEEVNGADWIWYGKSNGLLFFYDTEDITFLRHNINKVWIANIPESEENRVRHIQNQRKAGLAAPEDWGFLKALYEINCRDKTCTLLESRDYNIKDELIDKHTVKDPSPTHILPKTMMEELYKNVCGKKDTKEKGP